MEEANNNQIQDIVVPVSDIKEPEKRQANQYTPDEREQICWDFYVESLRKGQPNAFDSAIKAGYAEDTAKNITLTGWYKERLSKLKRKEMLSKAERNLDKVLDFEVINEEGKVNTPVASLVIDVSKTIVKTLGKDEGYSERIENTGKGGKDLFNPIAQQKAEEAIENFLNDNTGNNKE